MSNVYLQNARHPEQAERMRFLQENNLCFFCFEGKSHGIIPDIVEHHTNWYVAKNRYGLEESVHHYMIVPKRHVVGWTELDKEETAELPSVIKWVEAHLGTQSYSTFTRTGDPLITGGTLKHLHIHFIVGGPRPKDFTIEQALPVVLGFKKR